VDRAFLREQLGDVLVAELSLSRHVRSGERGVPRPITELEPRNRTALAQIRTLVDATLRDWPRYTRHAVEFHRRNATAWANARVGEDLATQIDPTFVLGPAALAVTA
jgi:CO dehydrogenase maturation factor